MMAGRVGPAIRQRLLFLAFGNLFLLLAISAIVRQRGALATVLGRCLSDTAPVVLAGLGLTGIMFTGAIDLSIASILAVSATVYGICVHGKLAPLSSYAACVTTAWLLSLLNAELVVLLGVPAIIVTLAGLPLYRGVALILADVAIPHFGGNIPVPDEAYHGPGKVYSGWLAAIIIPLSLCWEAWARTPRHWLGLGSSEEACQLAGLNPKNILRSSFAVGGLFLGLAALVYATRVQSIEPSRIALGFELQVIGAVVLGGTNVFGWEGSYAGTVLGALFLYLIAQVLTYVGASAYIQDALAGAIIVTVIGLDCALRRKAKLLEELT